MGETRSFDLLAGLAKSNAETFRDARNLLTGGRVTKKSKERASQADDFANELYASLPRMEYRSAERITHLNRLGAYNLRSLDVEFEALNDLAKKGMPIVWCPDGKFIEQMLGMDEPKLMDENSANLLIKQARASVFENLSRRPSNYEGISLFNILDEALVSGRYKVSVPFGVALLERISADFLMKVHGSYQRARSSSGLLTRFGELRVDTYEFDQAVGATLRHHLIACAIHNLFIHGETKEVGQNQFRIRRTNRLNRNSISHYMSEDALSPASAAIAYGMVSSLLVEYLHSTQEAV